MLSSVQAFACLVVSFFRFLFENTVAAQIATLAALAAVNGMTLI
jgi:hypothetical protein